MLGKLSESDVDKDPGKQFELWLNEASKAEVPEWQAMTLSTVAGYKPTSRIVYLRQFENHAYWFYTNYNSSKSKQLRDNPNACLNFFWPQLERQIRLEGLIELCHDKTSDEYFRHRPLESKLGAWASPQSAILNGREELEEQLKHYSKKFEGMEIPRPPHWGGYIFRANYYEFWQGRKSRLHDRISYTKTNKHWVINRLAP